MKERISSRRMLAVDLCTQGFGYAVFDGSRNLADWGIRRISGQKNAGSLKKIKELSTWYTPDVIALEDCTARGCLKRARIRRLSEQVAVLAERLEIPTQPVRWSLVRLIVGNSVKATKYDIASRVADTFPHLKARLPAKRKVYMSEDERMNIFDAVALGLTATAIDEKRRVA